MDEEFVAINHFQITDLGLVKFDDGEEDFTKVLDRTTGAPRAGVRVTVEQQVDRQESTWKTLRRFTTGPDGRIPAVKANRTQIRYRLQDGDDVFVSNPEYVYRNDRENRNRKRAYTPLFTDRSIYRPGQTVHVYGITLEKDRENMPQLLTDEKRTLTLYDVNGQEMGKAEVRSDAFSRFSHSFKLPEGGLTGNFRIQTEGGSMSFRVEEYKRPRFQVELEAPDFVVAGEVAEVSGKATLYAGPGLNDAKVSYRVFLEEVRYWWWGRGNNNNRELATSGETTTDGNGAFRVSFTPEEGLGKKRTRYRYVIETDVADDTGETHAAETSVALRSDKPVIGLRPSEKVLDVNDSLTIEASGSDENLTIDYRIVRVAKPDAALVDRKWPFPDRPVLSQDDYGSWFPDLAASGSKPLAEWQQLDRLYHSGQITLTAGKGAA
ncbi:MAG: MG2 domain-containing protein, partial [Bacteroidota bacterium]